MRTDVERGEVGDERLDARAPGRSDGLSRVGEPHLVAADEHQVVPVGAELEGGLQPDPGGGAGDDDGAQPGVRPQKVMPRAAKRALTRSAAACPSRALAVRYVVFAAAAKDVSGA